MQKSPMGDFFVLFTFHIFLYVIINNMEHILQGEEEMGAFALDFLHTLTQQKERATVVGLSGDLGSGKTTFAQFFAQGLHIEERIVSPTYVIAKFYDIPNNPKWSKFVHIDAYRIEDPEEMRVLKWDGIIADSRHVVFVEWPERLQELLPEDVLMLQFRFINQGVRAVTY
jgi:tRNA threonylcarbamoyladenosine biosynthesis protein TsaE